MLVREVRAHLTKRPVCNCVDENGEVKTMKIIHKSNGRTGCMPTEKAKINNQELVESEFEAQPTDISMSEDDE